MSEIKDIKDTMVKGLKEILHTNCTLSPPDDIQNKTITVVGAGDYCFPSQNIEGEAIISKNFAKCVKLFVENSLLNVIDEHINDTVSTSNETWKIDVHNLSKTLLDHSKVLCLQDNLTNILDSCLNEIQDANTKHFNDTELDVSPLLQPGHIIEIVECLSADKPVDVRLNSLQLLLRSHFSEAVNGENWPMLQKKLVENLCDSNPDIFLACFRAHNKLASSSSPTALKECALNLTESLVQLYYQHPKHENKSLALVNPHFHRMVNISHLLLKVIQEATLNIARFGESRIEEIIDNFIQLLAVSVHSKQSGNKHLMSPLAVISYLDPNGHWLANLTHFTMSRKLFFLSLQKNSELFTMLVDEVVDWISEPQLPLINTTKVVQGELNFNVHKYGMFCHSLAVFVILCPFSAFHSLFPLSINRKESPLSIEIIIKMMVTFLNESKFNETIFHSSEVFKVFFAQNLAKLLCIKEPNGSFFMLMLLKPNDDQGVFANVTKVKVLDFVSQSIHLYNPFFGNETLQKKKVSLFSHCFIMNSSEPLNQNTKPKHDLERQNSFCLQTNSESCESIPFGVYLKQIKKLTIHDLKGNPCLIQVMTRVLKNSNGYLGANLVLNSNIIQHTAEMYYKLQENIKDLENKYDSQEATASNVISEFFLQASTSPLIFFILQQLKVVGLILSDRLQQPLLEWSDPVWLMFVSKSTMTSEGYRMLHRKNNEILRKELFLLWNIIEEDCSGSDIPLEEAFFNLLKVVASLGLSLQGVKALLNESRDDSEITITDDSDLRPSNLSSLLENFALNIVNCNPDNICHLFALKVLETFVSNIDSAIYLQNKFKFQEALLKLQSFNRVDEHSEVIIDECSLLRHKIIEKTYFPGCYRAYSKPSHLAPRPESTLARTKPRSRGNGELARWLSETKQGLHDQNWLKHARKLYRNTCLDDVRGSIIQDLLEQVVKVLPENRGQIAWRNNEDLTVSLTPEEHLGIQIVMRYGTHHRLMQATQQNIDNLTQLILLAKCSLSDEINDFNGFDWFVASAYLICSGNIEKSQIFLSLASTLPTAPMLWPLLGEPLFLAQIGTVLETIVSEESPAGVQALQNFGLSWWQLCHTWLLQCWWNVLDWPYICHWFTLCILHQIDHMVYFCATLLQANQERILRMAHQGTLHEFVKQPLDKFQLTEARVLVDKLHKKYHNALNAYLAVL